MPIISSTVPAQKTTTPQKKRFEFPDIYVILFSFIVLVAFLTWIVPAGSYERQMLPNGRESVVPGSYQVMEQTPVGIMDVVTAIPVGLREASSVVFLTLLVGGAVGVIRKTGVINMGINAMMRLLGRRTELLIPVLMGIFSLIAAFIGTPELGIAYLPIVLPLMLKLGYDTITATGLVLCATTLGFAFGITPPATVGIGHMLADLPMFSGAWYRTIFYFLIQFMCAWYIMRYAARVKANPAFGSNFDVDQELRQTLTADSSEETFTSRQRFAGIATLVMFVGVIASILKFALGFDEISGLFVVMAVITSLLVGFSPNKICANFNESFREILVGAMICGIARGVSVILESGNIMDTIVFHLAEWVGHLPQAFTAVGMLFVQTMFNFLVPSGSGQSLITLPILIPLADLVGLTRQVVVLSTHWGDGITNILFPTSGYFVAILVIGRVSLAKWIKFYFPLFLGILATATIGLVIAQMIELGPF
ncbi:YfcC family protein [Kistimonas asteriae]|uniref:YfcC family protein n=1 Tax=Kistimonas asteriae TaxID=517724 RepID=UPI001BA47D95|nr:YfcC family protein [Kistimonas asteriae]